MISFQYWYRYRIRSRGNLYIDDYIEFKIELVTELKSWVEVWSRVNVCFLYYFMRNAHITEEIISSQLHIIYAYVVYIIFINQATIERKWFWFPHSNYIYKQRRIFLTNRSSPASIWPARSSITILFHSSCQFKTIQKCFGLQADMEAQSSTWSVPTSGLCLCSWTKCYFCVSVTK